MSDLTGIGAVADLAGKVVDRFFPNKTEQERAEMAAAMVIVQGQIDTNKVEAGSSSIFVAGWRPFIGWVCGVACTWNWVGLPVVKMGFAIAGKPLALSPADLTEMLPILMGMLGLGTLRTAEKFKGVAR